jgi:hypothetical protein
MGVLDQQTTVLRVVMGDRPVRGVVEKKKSKGKRRG